MQIRNVAVLALAGVSGGRRHAIHLALTLAITTCLWLILSAIAAPFVARGYFSGTGLSLSNGSQANGTLPIRYADRIQSITGVRNTAWLGALAVGCGSTPETVVTLNAYGGPGTATILKREKIDTKQVAQWLDNPRGIIISSRLAKLCGWHLGQGIEPPSLVTGKGVSLRIDGIFQGNGTFAYAHYPYINRIGLIGGSNHVYFFRVEADDERDNEQLAARIEAAFAHDFPSVRAVSNATVQSSWARFGKLQQLLSFVLTAIWLCVTSIWMSVLAHHVSGKRAVLATLLVLGFDHMTLIAAQLLEVSAIALLGVLVGIALAQLASSLDVWQFLDSLPDGMHIPAWSFAQISLWTMILLGLASIWPVVLIARMSAVAHEQG